MAQLASVIQPDVARAFAVRAERLFHRKNNQIYAIVGVNPAEGVVSDVWFDRFDSQDEFRAVLSHIREIFETGGYRYWLADLRFMASDFMESEAWLVRELMPAVIAAGLEREAVVLPGDALTKEGQDVFATASKALGEIADGRVRGFTDMKLARQWLYDGALPQA